MNCAPQVESLDGNELEQITGGALCDVEKALHDAFKAAGDVSRATGQTGAASTFYIKSIEARNGCIW